MIDMDKFMDSCKAYQKIIDDVTIDECICVAMSIPIDCNHEEMIKKAIIQRLWNAEQIRTKVIDEYYKAMHEMIEGDEELGFVSKIEIQELNELVAEQLKEHKC